MMFGFLMAVEVVVSILLIIAVLMQASKGGGLAGTFGGGNVGMVFGVRRTADFLIKATQWLAVIFGALAIIINVFFLPRAGTDVESALQRSAQQQAAPTPTVPQLPPAQQPATPEPAAPAK